MNMVQKGIMAGTRLPNSPSARRRENDDRTIPDADARYCRCNYRRGNNREEYEMSCPVCGHKIKSGAGISPRGSFYNVRGKLIVLDGTIEICLSHVRGSSRNNMATRRSQEKAIKNLLKRRNDGSE